jgi:hypothetical protein
MKEKINRSNYELWLIDYLDQKLTADEKSEVECFLQENPDIREEFEDLNEIVLEDTVLFHDKEKLKKTTADLLPENIENVDDFMIANLEGDLTLQEQRDFNILMKSDEKLEKEYAYYTKTKTFPDHSIVYPQKELLKKSSLASLSKTRDLRVQLFSIAAVLLIMLVLVNAVFFKPNFYKGESIAALNYQSDENVSENRRSWSFHSEQIQEMRKSVGSQEFQLTAYQNDLPPTINDKETQHEAEQLANDLDTEKSIEDKVDESTEMKKATPYAKNYKIEREDKPALALNTSRATSLNQFLVKQFREKALNEEVEESDQRKLSLWDVADAGLQGVGRLFNRDLKLQKQYNQDGQIVAVAYQSPNFGFAAPVRRK